MYRFAAFKLNARYMSLMSVHADTPHYSVVMSRPIPLLEVEINSDICTGYWLPVPYWFIEQNKQKEVGNGYGISSNVVATYMQSILEFLRMPSDDSK